MEPASSSRAALSPGSLVQRRGLLMVLGLAASTTLAVSVLRMRTVGSETVAASEAGDAPTAGNPAGDLTVVAFSDYNCPDCKASAPQLQRFVADDPGLRLVHRDWPLLGAASQEAAQLALAARYQDGYLRAHDALVAARGRPRTGASLLAMLERAGLDIDRLTSDARDRADDIAAQLARTAALATALRLRGVPGYLVGGQRLTSGFDLARFQDLAARARAER